MYPEMTHKTLRMPDGCRLGYGIRANGADTTLMLIHGALCDATSLQHIALADDGQLDVLLPDLRGHGQSTDGTTEWTLELLARDMLAIVEAEQVGRLIVAGESFGALVAARMATLRPDRISLLICSEPPLSPARLAPVRQAILSAMPSNASARGLAAIMGYAPSTDAHQSETTFHAVLTGTTVPLILLHGTGGSGSFATVVDQTDRIRLSGVPSITLLAVEAADHLVLRAVGSSLVRALLAEQRASSPIQRVH